MKFGTFGAVQTRDNGISSQCSEALNGTSSVSRNNRKVKGTVGRDFLTQLFYESAPAFKGTVV